MKHRHPDLPVMMVTAYGDDERRRRASERRRRRVPNQAGRFRSVEGAVAPAPLGSGPKETKVRLNVRYRVASTTRRRSREGLFRVDLSRLGEASLMAAVLAIGAIDDHGSQPRDRGGEETFAGAPGNGRDTPVAAIGAPASPSGTFSNLSTIRGAEVSVMKPVAARPRVDLAASFRDDADRAHHRGTCRCPGARRAETCQLRLRGTYAGSRAEPCRQHCAMLRRACCRRPRAGRLESVRRYS